MRGKSLIECMTLVSGGSLALLVGEYIDDRRVYLVEGALAILSDRDLETCDGATCELQV
ncbi:MAG: hypothetical protein FJY85_00755 [Deltaproteobacteria bacterium]|nr:hypothetical protein [Deltaproteobacteria bacterium]